MHNRLAVLLAIMVAFSGCLSFQDSPGAPSEEETEPETPEAESPEEEPGPEESEIATGGDPENDVSFNQAFKYPESAKWTQEHHFRIIFKVNGEEGRLVRMTMDVGEALNEAELEWVGPGVPLIDLNPDPRSVIIQQISSAGIVTETVDVEARQAGSHALEIAFRNIGGLYAMYFDTVQAQVEGAAVASFPNAEDATGRRGEAQWQGDDLWGLRTTTKAATIEPGSTFKLSVYVQAQGKRADQTNQPIELTAAARVPSQWDDVIVSPSESTDVQGNLLFSIEAKSEWEDAGRDIAYLDVSDGTTTITATFNIAYTD